MRYNLSTQGIGTVAIDGPRFEEFLRSRKEFLEVSQGFAVGLHSWVNVYAYTAKSIVVLLYVSCISLNMELRSRSSLGGEKVEEESKAKASKVTLRRAASEPPRPLTAGLERAGSPPVYRKQQSKDFEHATPPREKRMAWEKESRAGRLFGGLCERS